MNTAATPITPALPWDQARWPTRSFEHAKDSVDVLIELGAQIEAYQTDYLKRRGVRPRAWTGLIAHGVAAHLSCSL